MQTRLRRMGSEDLTNVLRWRNHDDVRRLSIRTHQITLEEHQQWFLSSRRTIKYIFELNEEPVGVVLFKHLEEDAHYEWSFYLNLYAKRPKGLGRLMMTSALFHFRQIKEAAQIIGVVKPENRHSQKLHLQLGFEFQGGEGGLLKYHYSWNDRS